MRRLTFITAVAIVISACQSETTGPDAENIQTWTTSPTIPRNRAPSGDFAPERSLDVTGPWHCRKVCADKNNNPLDQCSWQIDTSTQNNAANNSNQEPPAGREWLIKPFTVDEIASFQGQHFEIVLQHKDFRTDISPAIVVEKMDRLTLKSESNQIWLTHDRGDFRNPAFVSSARLTPRPAGGPYLWLEGYAYVDAGSTDAVGIFRVFRLRDRDNTERYKCRHSSQFDTTKSWCRSVLVEFYDANDERAARQAPVLNENVKPIDREEACSPNRETNDGEGDEGPNKPR